MYIVVGIGIILHFYCLVAETSFYSDVVECLPLDPVAQFRFPLRAVGIFLHPVTYRICENKAIYNYSICERTYC